MSKSNDAMIDNMNTSKSNLYDCLDGVTFTPTKCTTAEDKMRFAKQFIKFVKHGFKLSDFPKWFYQELSNCRGHIAHYNQGGFYDTWFESPQKRCEFLRVWLSDPIYGDPAYTFSDVEMFLQKWLLDNPGMLEDVRCDANKFNDDANYGAAISAFRSLSQELKEEFLKEVR